MDVDTRVLRYFAAVADEGNLTRAAQRLFVSQPALTKQIKQLESQLGVRLFTRAQAGVTLTPAGPTPGGGCPCPARGGRWPAGPPPCWPAGTRPYTSPGPPPATRPGCYGSDSCPAPPTKPPSRSSRRSSAAART